MPQELNLQSLRKAELLIFDLDGVIYRGRELIEGVAPFFAYLDQAKLPYAFLTNNSASTKLALTAKLSAMGFKGLRPQQVNGSADAVRVWLEKNASAGQQALVFGMDGLKEAVLAAGLNLTASGDSADYLVTGFNSLINYEQISAAMAALEAGAIFIAANYDRTIPTETGVRPGSGSLAEVLCYASSRRPDHILGKPNKVGFEAIAQSFKVRPANCLMFGDRPETDLLGAALAGMQACLMLTGITKDLNEGVQVFDQIKEVSQLKLEINYYLPNFANLVG